MPFFVSAFTDFRHVNQNSLIVRKGSVIVLCHISTVRGLVPPQASKNSLNSKCNSSLCFEFPKATDLKSQLEFGAEDETLIRIVYKTGRDVFIGGRSSGI